MGSGFEVKDDCAILRINAGVYPIERIYATAYVYLDEYYMVLDGDKDKEVILTARPKKKGADLERFSLEFFNQLISLTNYLNQFRDNKEIINTLMQRALLSATPESRK